MAALCNRAGHYVFDVVFNDTVTALSMAVTLHVPEHCKNFYKFWWSEEFSILKEASITSHKLWKAAGGKRVRRVRLRKSNYGKIIPMHMMIRGENPGQATEGSAVSSIKCDRYWHLD